MLMHFVPQSKVSEIKEIDWTNSKFYRYKNREDIKNFFQGKLTLVKRVVDVGYVYFDELGDYPAGWLYVQFIGASNIETSQYKRESYNVIFSFEYRKFTEEGIQQLIGNTIWDIETNDPVDGFEEIMERIPYCRDYGAVETIEGIKDGVPGFSLLDGSWKKTYSSSSSSVSSKSSALDHETTSSSVSSYKSFSSQNISTDQTEMSQQDKKKIECESRGGEFVDGVCLASGGSAVSLQTEVTSSSAQALSYEIEEGSSSRKVINSGYQDQAQILQEEAQRKKDCESRGGTYADGVCIGGNIKFTESQQASSQSIDKESDALEDIQEIVEKVNNKELPIAGYWVHYGNGPFDWLYISQDGKSVAKLEGRIQWQRLDKNIEKVKLNNNNLKIIFKGSQESKENQVNPSQEEKSALDNIQENRENKSSNPAFPEE